MFLFYLNIKGTHCRDQTDCPQGFVCERIYIEHHGTNWKQCYPGKNNSVLY